MYAPRTSAALCLLLLGAVTSQGHSASVGTAQDGRLVDGFRLPLDGSHHRFAGPVRARGSQYATLEMAALVARAARTVEAAIPGAPLVLGDCSKSGGGAIERHRSHRSGRDVDLLFYVTDPKGRSTTSPGFRGFGDGGRCRDAGCRLRFDVARNWWLVRTLLASRRPAVQHVFVSEPLKKLLLAHGHDRGEHPDILARAEIVLRQPSDSSAHTDHFHVRTYCSRQDLAAGCVDGGLRWPWVDAHGRAKSIRPR